MSIFDFLLDNLFYVIIILGFISSLLAKKKREESGEASSQQSTLRRQDYDFDLEDEPLHRSSYERDPVQYEETIELNPNPSREAEPSFVEIHDAIRAEVREKKDKLRAIEKGSPIYTEDLLASSNQRIGGANGQISHLSDGDSISTKAVQGMMWAEIFGPPRAKKPHRSGSYRN